MIVVLAEHADVDEAKLARDAGVHLYAEYPARAGRRFNQR
jgi:hypothetical protein